MRTKGFAFRSGVYKFVVHIDKLSRDGYAFVGILFNGGNLNRFVGADIQGHGRGFLLCHGTTWHKGNQSTEKIRSFGSGSTLNLLWTLLMDMAQFSYVILNQERTSE